MFKSILIALALLALMSTSNAREYQSAECPGCQTASEWAASDAEYICDIDQSNPICESGEDEAFTDSDVGCTDDCLDSETN